MIGSRDQARAASALDGAELEVGLDADNTAHVAQTGDRSFLRRTSDEAELGKLARHREAGQTQSRRDTPGVALRVDRDEQIDERHPRRLILRAGLR